MSVIAILGIAVVLFGTASAPNGMIYFIVNLLFIGAGILFMSDNDKNQ